MEPELLKKDIIPLFCKKTQANSSGQNSMDVLSCICLSLHHRLNTVNFLQSTVVCPFSMKKQKQTNKRKNKLKTKQQQEQQQRQRQQQQWCGLCWRFRVQKWKSPTIVMWLMAQFRMYLAMCITQGRCPSCWPRSKIVKIRCLMRHQLQYVMNANFGSQHWGFKNFVVYTIKQ